MIPTNLFAWLRMAIAPCLAATVCLGLPAAVAAEYPDRTVTVIVPFPAGGTADALARVIARGLAPRLGKPVVVDNRPGAGGRVGTEAAARAHPDGHTLLMGSISTLAIEPMLRTARPYDPVRDFAPLTLATEMPFVLVVNNGVPARTVSELVQLGRRSDGLTYATWGVGTSSHLAGELFKRATGVRMTHVPYKGVVMALPEMISGQVSLMFGLPIDLGPHVKAGRLRALAVTGAGRMPMFPDVPTLEEAGISDVELRAWFGLVVPARTPPEIRQRLQTELIALLKSREFVEWAEGQGMTVVADGPEGLTRRIKVDAAMTGKLAETMGLKLE